MKEFIEGLLGKTLNLTPDQINELIYQSDAEGNQVLKPTALDDALQKNSEKIASLKKDEKTVREEGYSRGKKEALSNLEKSIKAEFGFDSTLEGEELVKELVNSKITESGKSKEITDDVIKAHPIYRELEKNKNKELDQFKLEKTAEIEKLHTEHKQSSFRKVATEKAKELFLSENPVLSEDETIRQNQIADFVARFESNNYQIEDDGTIVMFGEDGKRLEDSQGNIVKFESFVKEKAGKLFQFKKQDASGNAGAGKADETKGVKVPKDEGEYQTAFNNAKTTEERSAITKAWRAKQGQT